MQTDACAPAIRILDERIQGVVASFAKLPMLLGCIGCVTVSICAEIG
ncbi:hypothetical protein GCM10007857_77930 [Bradyrhizobium iriomotense]|uniref:Uncharacterized protein n=1 Tax=Bradyrhizobium iriomotense TaxID=441950 RepID=A0ABQ6B9N3_9BRAD|nr:hypothetical protein GCM10007857_77930 [Bradyrhizobium iriomotense]